MIMGKYKTFFILFISLILMTQVSTVVFADDNANFEIESGSIKNYTTPQAFLDDINNLEDGDIINIGSGEADVSKNYTINVNNIQIFGNGTVTFKANINNASFNVSGDGVKIKGITFRDFNSSGNGGAISWFGSDGNMTDCKFINCTIDVNSPIISWKVTNGSTPNSTITINTTTIDYSNTGNGGAIYWVGDGGSLTNCMFVNCRALNNGGVTKVIIVNGTNGSNCTFINFANTGIGGSIYWSALDGLMFNCTFINSRSDSDAGAVFWDIEENGIISDCKFRNCSTTNFGGAIKVFEDSISTQIINSKFEDCTAFSGGAVNWDFMADYGLILNCNFTNCINNDELANGGAICWYSDFGVVNNSIFINCTSNLGIAGGIYWCGYDGKVLNSKFENCTSDDGGAICWFRDSDNGLINNCTFKDCSSPDGGAILGIFLNNLTVSDCSFTNCSANYGGAICWLGVTEAKIYRCNFNKCHADIGGVIGYNTLVLDNVSFYSDNGKIGNNTFIDCSASECNGALIYNEGDNLFLFGEGTLVYNNGNISNPVSIIIFDNKTIDVTKWDVIRLYASAKTGEYTICDSNFNFIIRGKSVAPSFDGDKYVLNYTVSHGGVTLIDGSYNNAYNVTIKTASLVAPKDHVNIALKSPILYNNTFMTIMFNSDDGVVPFGTVNVAFNLKNYTTDVSTDGIAKIPIGVLNAGLYDVKIFYVENAEYLNATLYSSLNISKINASVKLSIDNINYGQNATLNIATFNEMTGSLDVRVGNLIIPNVSVNNKTVFISNLVTGLYDVVVFYPGDLNFNSLTTITHFNVSKAKTNLSTGIVKTPDENVDIYFNLMDIYGNPISGEVKVNVTSNYGYNKKFNVFTVDGKGSLSLKNLLNGHYSIMAQFIGDDYYTESSANDSFNISYIPKELYLSASNVTKFYKNGTQYTVKVTDDRGNYVPNKTVKVTLSSPKWSSSPSYEIVSDANGIATLTINLAVGDYGIKAKIGDYTIDNTITVLKITFRLDASDLTKYFDDKTPYTVKVTDYDHGNVIANEAVTVYLSSPSWSKPATYKITTNSDGVATLAINLNPGSYTMKATVGTALKNTAITVMKVTYNMKADSFTKYFKNDTQYHVKVTDTNGKAVANATVSVSISSSSWKKPVTYNIMTNDEGVATLNIGLAAGTYTLTANLGGNTVKSTVKVLPILTASSITKKVSQSASLKAKLVDGTGKPVSGGTVTFKVLSKTYTKTTDSSGYASLPINLNVGTWKFTVSNPSTGASTTATVTVKK